MYHALFSFVYIIRSERIIELCVIIVRNTCETRSMILNIEDISEERAEENIWGEEV
jgi:hypothetical protein